MDLKLSSTLKTASVPFQEGLIGEINVYFNPDSTINNVVVKVKSEDKSTLVAYFNATNTRLNANFDFVDLSYSQRGAMLSRVTEILEDIFK